MGAETSKSIPRRLRDPAFHQKFFVGDGLDVGAGGDPLSRYRPLFRGIDSVQTFDVPGSDADITGDATTLASIGDNVYDFVHSSHCLEHIADVPQALRSWLRVCKRGGHVIVIVPDWELYEHEVWPSVFNTDHKHCFTCAPITERWLRVWHDDIVISVPQLVCGMSETVVKVELLESTFLEGVLADQTIGIGECAIEFVLRKL
jgi:predicted SAM-dependent methyltransferase